MSKGLYEVPQAAYYFKSINLQSNNVHKRYFLQIFPKGVWIQPSVGYFEQAKALKVELLY